MASARLETESITDWASFHETCYSVFGFFDGYGRNMDAWIDCMSSLDEEGMTRFMLGNEELLNIEVTGTEAFNRRLPDILDALIECTAFVNQRYIESGRPPALSLIFL